MITGDVVKRHSKWIEHSPWVTQTEKDELGIIIRFERSQAGKHVIVLWSQIGISYEDADELCVQIKYKKCII